MGHLASSDELMLSLRDIGDVSWRIRREKGMFLGAGFGKVAG
jgi:hypothetical protein